MNAKAWRKVWELWQQLYPEESISSPCLIDYFVYNVVGKQFCKEKLFEFICEDGQHSFKWHSAKNTRCQICYQNGLKNKHAEMISKCLPCSDAEGHIAISQTNFAKSYADITTISTCPFAEICNEYGHKGLLPPKSISIKGRTGWIDAYTTKGNGGGGLMA